MSIDLTVALPTIRADRMSMRQLHSSDVHSLYEIFSDPAVTQYWGFERLRTFQDAEVLFEQIEQGRCSGTLFQWGIVLNGSDEVIGTTTICSWSREHRRAELGFALRRDSWGAGYGSEAARAMVGFGFDHMSLHRFEADADPRNEASLRILKGLGFKQEGHCRERYLLEGVAQDAILFGLLRSDWAARPAPA